MEAVSDLRIDPATLLLTISMLGFTMAAVSWSSAVGMPQYRSALIEWGKAMAAVGGASMLFFLHGHAPWFLTFLVGYALLLSMAYYCHRAVAEIFEVRRRKRIYLILAFGMSGVLAVNFLEASRQVAAFTISSAITAILVVTAWMVFRGINRRSMTSAWVAAGSALAMSVVFGFRAVLSALGDAAMVLPTATTAAQIGTLMSGALFTAAASIAFFLIIHERIRHEAAENACRDGLTGLYTRTAFFEKAEQLAAEAGPAGYSLVMLDIDHFKSINDTYGHLAGDVAIAHAARLIANSARILDMAGRYGGEEFCVLLPGCGEPEAAEFSRRLVIDASQQRVRLRDGRHIAFQLSAGHATQLARAPHGSRPESLSDVVGRADGALYQAKRSGRNQAAAAGPGPMAARTEAVL